MHHFSIYPTIGSLTARYVSAEFAFKKGLINENQAFAFSVLDMLISNFVIRVFNKLRLELDAPAVFVSRIIGGGIAYLLTTSALGKFSPLAAAAMYASAVSYSFIFFHNYLGTDFFLQNPI